MDKIWRCISIESLNYKDEDGEGLREAQKKWERIRIFEPTENTHNGKTVAQTRWAFWKCSSSQLISRPVYPCGCQEKEREKESKACRVAAPKGSR